MGNRREKTFVVANEGAVESRDAIDRPPESIGVNPSSPLLVVAPLTRAPAALGVSRHVAGESSPVTTVQPDPARAVRSFHQLQASKSAAVFLLDCSASMNDVVAFKDGIDKHATSRHRTSLEVMKEYVKAKIVQRVSSHPLLAFDSVTRLIKLELSKDHAELEDDPGRRARVWVPENEKHHDDARKDGRDGEWRIVRSTERCVQGDLRAGTDHVQPGSGHPRRH